MKYRANTSGKCPNCNLNVRFEEPRMYCCYKGTPTAVRDLMADWLLIGKAKIHAVKCPACGNTTITAADETTEFMVIPRGTARPPLHEAVPSELANDYREGALVASLSPKASAALSRRCLQTLLTMNGFRQDKLNDQLSAAYEVLPTYVQRFVDCIRHVGNLSAHPKWDRTTAEIVEVEPHEVEWLLDLLDALFDHFYVKPAEYEVKQAALDTKRQNALSKPPLSQVEP